MPDLSFIKIYDDLLDSNSCQSVIRSFNKLNDADNTPFMYRTETKGKTSIDFNVDFLEIKNQIPYPPFRQFNTILLPVITKAIERYKKDYPFIDELAAWKLRSWYNIQYYSEGEGYNALHCEHASRWKNINNHELKNLDSLTAEDHSIAGDRMLVWMIYLNDAQSGTEFPHQATTIKPKEGRVVVWPAYWTHPHKGVTPNKGDKYIATGWCSFYNPT